MSVFSGKGQNCQDPPTRINQTQDVALVWFKMHPNMESGYEKRNCPVCIKPEIFFLNLRHLFLYSGIWRVNMRLSSIYWRLSRKKTKNRLKGNLHFDGKHTKCKQLHFAGEIQYLDLSFLPTGVNLMLLHNGKFCIGCITNCVCIMCQIMSLFHDCSMIITINVPVL